MINPDADRDAGKRPPNPVENASIFSKFLFLWLRSLFATGLRRPIDEADIYATLREHQSGFIANQFDSQWQRECVRNPSSPSFLRVLIRLYGGQILGFGMLYTVLDVTCRVIQPLCLGGLVTYFKPGQTVITEQDAYYFAAGIVLCSLVPTLTFHPFILYIFQIGMKIRLGCCAMLYQKSLRVTKSIAVDGFDGQVINLMSNDVSKFDTCISLVHDLWKGPLELIVLGYCIFREIGLSGLVGIAFLISIIPLQAWLGKKSAHYRRETAKRTDRRVRFMNEIIQGIQVIKMYTWEKSFARIVDTIRRQEIKTISGTLYIRGTCISFNLISRVCIFLSLITYLYVGEIFTARQVFMVTSYFNYLYGSMLHFWSLALTSIAEGIVSAKRVQQFLLLPETKMDLLESRQREHDEKGMEEQPLQSMYNGTIDDNVIGKRLANVAGNANFNQIINRRNVKEKALKNGMVLDGATALWWNEEDKLKQMGISNISVTIEPGVLCAIIGPVGSGKSTLLQVMLGELQLDDGFIHINGRISYASQQPWLFEGSIKQNIVFVENFDEKRYNRVIQVCALEKDLSMLAHGDETIVGERGISLSGGQRARVSLARAIYKQADIYLLDDPLSAVDAHVGKYIFDNCIKDFLRAKVCVLVTHQLQYLKEVRHCLLMNLGQVEVQGTFKELKNSKSFTLLTNSPEDCDNQPPQEVIKQKPATQTPVKEEQLTGSVGYRTYFSYLRSVDSIIILLLVAILFVVAQVSMSGIDYFVSKWVNWEETLGESKVNPAHSKATDINVEILVDHKDMREHNIYLYSISILALLLLTLTRSFGFFKMCLRASITLHDKLFRGIIRAKMYFYNNNPSGRILNRFSKDIGSIDVQLPIAMMDCLLFFLEFFAVITLVAIVNYWLLLPTFVMSLLFYSLRYIYINAGRSIKRLEALTRSPIFSHTNSTLQGLATIRASNAQSTLMAEFDKHQDLNTSAWYLYLAATRAFALWLELVCVLYIASVTLSFLVMGNESLGGNVGLAITQVFNLIFMCQWGMRQTAELENQMTSVERVIEYAEQPSEPPMETLPKYRPDPDWPMLGKIRFSNFSLKYSDNGKRILHDINLLIQPKEKIGIVGRTGAGKSSIIQALFRLAYNEGTIEIDGFDIDSLGLHDLRSKLSIIPQDPILFSGTLRLNLDPFEEKADDAIWNALEQVELKYTVSQLANGLASKMCDGGSNFSMGQRQLICLARAILRNNRILILDEATANVDPETDKLIQNTIRTKFAECTVLTIAHRLHTVMDSDKVLVMDSGRVVEFGHPYELIQKSGTFKELIDQTGNYMSLTLIEIAKENYTKASNIHKVSSNGTPT